MWDAFCTMFWYATGEQIIMNAPLNEATRLYTWYLNLESKQSARVTGKERNKIIWVD